MDEPLDPSAVKAILLVAITTGTLGFTSHARTEMANDNLTEVDVVNVLRGGVVRAGEYVSASWRYRVETAKIVVVVGIRSADHAVVVTAWRIKRK